MRFIFIVVGISHFLKFYEKFPRAPPYAALARIFPLYLFGYERSLASSVAKATDVLQKSILNFDPHKLNVISFLNKESKVNKARWGEGE
jgi:hypothetical protein